MSKKYKRYTAGLFAILSCIPLEQISAMEELPFESEEAARKFFESAQPIKDQRHYIIDGNVAGDDIDGPLALLQLIGEENLPLAITTTHNYPVQRAKIAEIITEEIGLGNIPIYDGIGLDEKDSREIHNKLYSLWPSFFGYMDAKENEKKWYPKSGEAYREFYPNQFMVGSITGQRECYPNQSVRLKCDAYIKRSEKETHFQINNNRAVKEIITLASQHSSENKLNFIALGPLHNLAEALQRDVNIGRNIRLWSMGGDYPYGYNWLISPETTKFVLGRVETKVISSQFVRDNNLDVTEDEFYIFQNSNHMTTLGKAILKDWMNFNRGDVLKNKKNLCNPVTLMLFLHPDLIQTTQDIYCEFPCVNFSTSFGGKYDLAYKFKQEFPGIAYNKQGMEGKIVQLTSKESYSTIEAFEAGCFNSQTFIQTIKDPESLRRKIIYKIAGSFYPRISEGFFYKTVYEENNSKEDIVMKLNYATYELQHIVGFMTNYGK